MSRIDALGCLFLLGVLVSGRCAAQENAWSRVLPLPRPSGPYAVGTVVVRLVDTATLSPRTRLVRPITVRAF